LSFSLALSFLKGKGGRGSGQTSLKLYSFAFCKYTTFWRKRKTRGANVLRSLVLLRHSHSRKNVVDACAGALLRALLRALLDAYPETVPWSKSLTVPAVRNDQTSATFNPPLPSTHYDGDAPKTSRSRFSCASCFNFETDVIPS
jgi:hypothetical protein